jgi:hypothetical protein
MSSIIDALQQADDAIAAAVATMTIEDLDREIANLFRWRQRLIDECDKLKAVQAARPPAPPPNGKSTYSPARLPVPLSTPAVLPVPGLTMPAPEEETPLPEPARANGCRQPAKVAKDQRRMDVVRFILRNGPATVGELREELDIPVGSMGALLAHEWFLKTGGRVEITNDARQAVEAET